MLLSDSPFCVITQQTNKINNVRQIRSYHHDYSSTLHGLRIVRLYLCCLLTFIFTFFKIYNY